MQPPFSCQQHNPAQRQRNPCALCRRPMWACRVQDGSLFVECRECRDHDRKRVWDEEVGEWEVIGFTVTYVLGGGGRGVGFSGVTHRSYKSAAFPHSQCCTVCGCVLFLRGPYSTPAGRIARARAASQCVPATNTHEMQCCVRAMQRAEL